MRPGETLAVVDGLRSMGESRRDIAAYVAEIHSWGAVLVDAETGKRSDRDGVEMMAEALARHLDGDSVQARHQIGVEAVEVARGDLPVELQGADATQARRRKL